MVADDCPRCARRRRALAAAASARYRARHPGRNAENCARWRAKHPARAYLAQRRYHVKTRGTA